jgi:hypothetical protein
MWRRVVECVVSEASKECSAFTFKGSVDAGTTSFETSENIQRRNVTSQKTWILWDSLLN